VVESKFPEKDMPANDPSFDDVIVGLRSGDAVASERVFHRFARRLIELARSRMEERVKRKVDPEDVVQSAFRSFFRLYAEGEFELKDWDGLWALLTVIVLRKCGRRVQYYRAFCRDVGREQSPPVANDSSIADFEAIAREPTPQEAAIMTETVEQLFALLDEQSRSVIQLALQGWKVGEIGTQLGVAQRTVYRTLGRVRLLLERQSKEEPQPSA